uniref:uncharacterized protein LOC124069624 n=1 Tax=Scatophagus argus TaxID=75038 RepID=UPI001ED84728|nr:uncharacterized protein LOC124069624 [Scatophagus argus]
MADTAEGKAILNSLDITSVITIKERRCLVRILVSYLMDTFGETPTSDTKSALASSLVQTFPCLKDPSTSGCDTWYAKGRLHRPATGFLEERLRNIRKSIRSAQRSQREEESMPRPIFLPASPICPERAEQMLEWLKKNSRPTNQVEEYMQATAVYRAEWVKANSSKTMQEVLHEFPRHLCPGMIAQDFQTLYAEAAPKLFETWNITIAEKVLRLARREGKLQCATDSLPQDVKGYKALRLLPSLLPPQAFKMGKKMMRPTVSEALKAFIDLQPVGINMVEYLRDVESSRPYPFVLVLGDEGTVSQAFVILVGNALEESSVLHAVDVCFKSFYVFDVNFPRPCSSIWEFLQSAIFQLGTKAPTPSMAFVMAILEADKV